MAPPKAADNKNDEKASQPDGDENAKEMSEQRGKTKSYAKAAASNATTKKTNDSQQHKRDSSKGNNRRSRSTSPVHKSPKSSTSKVFAKGRPNKGKGRGRRRSKSPVERRQPQRSPSPKNPDMSNPIAIMEHMLAEYKRQSKAKK